MQPALSIHNILAQTACRYKVWFLKACIEAEHSQTVHLILSKGGIQCDITKHLTKVCIPSTDNKLPITPNKAMFKDLLEGNQPVSKEQLEEAIANMVSSVYEHNIFFTGALFSLNLLPKCSGSRGLARDFEIASIFS